MMKLLATEHYCVCLWDFFVSNFEVRSENCLLKPLYILCVTMPQGFGELFLRCGFRLSILNWIIEKANTQKIIQKTSRF